MNEIFKISWRNIWRNPGRSGVLLAAIVAGVWAGVTTSAVTNGFVDQRFDRLINEVSHLQIHHPEFRTERETSMFIPQAEEIIEFLSRDDRLETLSARAIAEGLIQSPANNAGIQVFGVDPDLEQATTSIQDDIVEGEYLDSDIRNPIIIGRKLAEKLNADLGMRLVLTFQDVDEDLTSTVFNVAGIYTSLSGAEERLVYTRMSDLQEHLSENPVYHQIAVVLRDEAQIESFVAELNDTFPGSETLSWYNLSPELRLYADLGNQVVYYLMGIIMLALAFGILNTMLMAIFERTRELGMLMAVGMNKARVFFMICLESILITLTGASAGMVLSALSIRYLHSNGLDLSAFSEGLAEFGYDAILYPSLGAESFLGITLMVAIIAIMASIYPALKAIRLEPAVAARD
jgi:ABC-type lipoprotein release transport system permease subunit